MKRVNNIYNKICDIDVIMDMYDKVIKTNTKNKKELLQEIEKLPIYQNGKGVCIGNMVSQIVATFYLDKLYY